MACGELGLVESIYGWQVLDRIMRRAAELIDSLRGSVLSTQAVLALNAVAGEEVLIFEPGSAASHRRGTGAEETAGTAAAVARKLEEGFGGEEFASMTPRLTFRVGYALIQDNAQFRFERIVYRALEQARTQRARREQRRRTEWGVELRRILRDGEIVSLYQPVVRLDDLATVGYEVFSSGPPTGPLNAPGLLFALAERLGLSTQLDRACRRAALSLPLPDGAKLFLNTRPENLSDSEWEGIDRDPANVVIEVAEPAMHDAEMLRVPAARLKQRGFAIALDDVGTGYSSLRAIEASRPDFLKVDLSLVHELDRSLLKQEVVSSILQIASRIGAEVVAEGVETREELEALRRGGVRIGQGYLFGRPSPVIAPARPVDEERVR